MPTTRNPAAACSARLAAFSGKIPDWTVQIPGRAADSSSASSSARPTPRPVLPGRRTRSARSRRRTRTGRRRRGRDPAEHRAVLVERDEPVLGEPCRRRTTPSWAGPPRRWRARSRCRRRRCARRRASARRSAGRRSTPLMRPRGRCVAEVAGHGVERAGHEREVRPHAALLPGDQPGVREHLEVVGDRRLAEPDRSMRSHTHASAPSCAAMSESSRSRAGSASALRVRASAAASSSLIAALVTGVQHAAGADTGRSSRAMRPSMRQQIHRRRY